MGMGLHNAHTKHMHVYLSAIIKHRQLSNSSGLQLSMNPSINAYTSTPLATPVSKPIKQNRGPRQVRSSGSCWEPFSQHPEHSHPSASWQCQAWEDGTSVGTTPLGMMKNYRKDGSVAFYFESKNEHVHIHHHQKIRHPDSRGGMAQLPKANMFLTFRSRHIKLQPRSRFSVWETKVCMGFNTTLLGTAR